MSLYVYISFIFCPLAAAMAFIITYEEYKKHLSKDNAMKYALEMGVFTAILFVVIGIAGGYFFQTFQPIF